MSLYCPFCGEKLKDGAKFCNRCGKNVEAYTTGEIKPPEYEPEEQKHSYAFILRVIVAVLFPLIGFIIGIYLYIRKDSKIKAIAVMMLAVFSWIVSNMIFRI